MNKKLTTDIYSYLNNQKNVLLIGPTDSGKTWYVKNTLIPFLQSKNLEVVYFSDPDFSLDSIPNKDSVVIVDEIEIFFDQDFLTSRSIEDKPYYSAEYLAKVKNWHKNLAKLTNPSLFVLTRNDDKEISNIVRNLKTTDWGAEVKCLVFTKKDR